MWYMADQMYKVRDSANRNVRREKRKTQPSTVKEEKLAKKASLGLHLKGRILV